MAADKVIQWINQEWLVHSDPYMTKFPILNSPVIFVSGIVLSLFIIFAAQFLRSLSPRQTKSATNQHDIRPLLLIHDGFCFGVYGVGALMFLIVGSFGKMLLTCDFSEGGYVDEFHSAAIKHLTYTYLLICFVCFGHPLIQVLGGHPVDSLVDIVHHSLWSCLVAAYMTFNPIGLSLVVPILDCLGKVVHYGSSVLAVTNRDPSIAIKWSDYFRCIFFTVLSAHSYYFSSVHKTCSPPVPGHSYQPALLNITAIYTGVVALVSGIRLLLNSTPIDASSFEKQVLSSGRSLRKNVKLTKIPVVNLMK